MLEKDRIMVFMKVSTSLAQTRPCQRMTMLDKERWGDKRIDKKKVRGMKARFFCPSIREQSRRGDYDDGTRDTIRAKTQISHLTKESLSKHRTPRTSQLI
jgi:hypothetical protein